MVQITQPQSATLEVLAGYIERVTYHNAENGFCVLRTKARGRRDVVTVVGYAAVISVGEWITASGEWANDRTHGSSGRVFCGPRRQLRLKASRNVFRPA
jgi:exodeoxyribonuclease V alpha subunit